MKRVVASSFLLAALSLALLAAPASAQFEAAEHDTSTSEPAPGPAPTVPAPVPTVPPPTLPTGSNRLVYIDREPEWKLGKCEGDCDKDEVRDVRHISASASASAFQHIIYFVLLAVMQGFMCVLTKWKGRIKESNRLGHLESGNMPLRKIDSYFVDLGLKKRIAQPNGGIFSYSMLCMLIIPSSHIRLPPFLIYHCIETGLPGQSGVLPRRRQGLHVGLRRQEGLERPQQASLLHGPGRGAAHAVADPIADAPSDAPADAQPDKKSECQPECKPQCEPDGATQRGAKCGTERGPDEHAEFQPDDTG